MQNIIENQKINMTMINYKIPNDIEEEAKEYMADVISQLDQAGVLVDVDSAALNMLARHYSMFIKANKQLKESELVFTNSAGNLTPNPLIKIIKDSQIQCLNVMKDFGLTAKSRTKLPKLDNSDKELSPLEQFVKEAKEVR